MSSQQIKIGQIPPVTKQSPQIKIPPIPPVKKQQNVQIGQIPPVTKQQNVQIAQIKPVTKQQNVQIKIQVSPPIVPVNQANPKKKIIMMVIFLVLAFLFIGGGIYLLFFFQKRKKIKARVVFNNVQNLKITVMTPDNKTVDLTYKDNNSNIKKLSNVDSATIYERNGNYYFSQFTIINLAGFGGCIVISIVMFILAIIFLKKN
jgi:hypothetical protein